jgi:hypothetical protein
MPVFFPRFGSLFGQHIHSPRSPTSPFFVVPGAHGHFKGLPGKRPGNRAATPGNVICRLCLGVIQERICRGRIFPSLRSVDKYIQRLIFRFVDSTVCTVHIYQPKQRDEAAMVPPS